MNKTRIHKIIIRQLDANGKCYREFKLSAKPIELETKIEKIKMAYNMDHTVILVDGIAQF